jgi:hypothetical protein
MPKFCSIAWLALPLSLLSMQAMAACGTSTDPEHVVQAEVDAFNAHDIDAFAACFADDVAIVDLAGKRPVRNGLPALRDAYAFLRTSPKDFHVEIVKRIVSGPIVVDHERALGLPAEKGKPEAVAVYEVRNGKILNMWFPPPK